MTPFEQAVHKAKKFLNENPDDIRATLATALAGNLKTKKRAVSRNGPFNTQSQ